MNRSLNTATLLLAIRTHSLNKDVLGTSNSCFYKMDRGVKTYGYGPVWIFT